MYGKKKIYVINPFIKHTLPNGDIVLQNKTGLVRVTEVKMKNTIERMEYKNNGRISSKEFFELFNQESESAINFLLKNNIIFQDNQSILKISRINFYTNCNLIDELVSRSFDKSRFESFRDIRKFIKKINNNQDELFVIFLNPYEKSIATKLSKLLKENSNTYSIMSYLNNNSMYIDSIYSAKWKSPCHLCHIGFIESENRLGILDGITYQQLIDNLFIEDNRFKIELPIEFRDALNISSQLINRIELLVGLKDEKSINVEEYLKGVVMDLKTYKVYDDLTHHWELCDCYE